MVRPRIWEGLGSHKTKTLIAASRMDKGLGRFGEGVASLKLPMHARRHSAGLVHYMELRVKWCDVFPSGLKLTTYTLTKLCKAFIHAACSDKGFRFNHHQPTPRGSLC